MKSAMPSCALLLLSIGLIAGCASAAKPSTTTPARTEITVAEPTVVTVPAPAYSGPVVELPPWPAPVESYTPQFQCGALTLQALLHHPAAERIEYPPVCEAVARALPNASMPADSASWPHERLPAFMLGLGMLSGSLAPNNPERNLAVAWSALALHAALPLQLLPNEAPAEDPNLSEETRRAYAEQARVRNGLLLHGALYTLHACAALEDAALGGFRSRCGREEADLAEQVKADHELAAALSSQRIALRAAAAGERPPGPMSCWSPGVLFQGAPSGLPTPSQAQPDPSVADFDQLLRMAADPHKANACALAPGTKLEPAAPWAKPPSLEEEFAGPWPRDRRYGPRDPANGARVSVQVVADGSLDARPFLTAPLHAALAKCLAEDTTSGAGTTFALAAEVAVSARGRARVKKLADVHESPETSAASSPALGKCVRAALAGLLFTCTANDEPANATVTVCLRRE